MNCIYLLWKFPVCFGLTCIVCVEKCLSGLNCIYVFWTVSVCVGLHLFVWKECYFFWTALICFEDCLLSWIALICCEGFLLGLNCIFLFCEVSICFELHAFGLKNVELLELHLFGEEASLCYRMHVFGFKNFYLFWTAFICSEICLVVLNCTNLCWKVCTCFELHLFVMILPICFELHLFVLKCKKMWLKLMNTKFLIWNVICKAP